MSGPLRVRRAAWPISHRNALAARPQFASARTTLLFLPLEQSAGREHEGTGANRRSRAPRVQASLSLQSRIASETHVQSEPDRTGTQGRNLIPSGHTEGIAESKGIRPYVADIANIE